MNNSLVKRIFVEKKPGFNIEAQSLLHDLRDNLGIVTLNNIRIINRYDMEGVSSTEYELARNTVFAEPSVDLIYDEQLEFGNQTRVLAIEYLPGQYDQRADSAAQCIQILSQREKPEIKCAKLVVLEGNISDEELERIRKYCINPVECHEATLAKPVTLKTELKVPEKIVVLDGSFI